MRLSQEEIDTIKSSVLMIDENAEIYLFGSRTDDSKRGGDIDVLIVLDGKFNYWEESKRSSELIASLSLQYDVVISRKIASVMEYSHSKMPLYINIRKEGVAV